MMLSSLSSKSYSSSMSPTICSSTSSIVTRPDTPPYSSTTIAMWLRFARNSRSSTFRRFDSGTNTAGRSVSLEVEGLGTAVPVEELLREQDADDVVLVLADHREPRVARLEHERDELGRIVVDRHDVHLRARDHDVAHRHLGDLQHALDHRQRVGVEELALERAVQELEELLAVLGLARQERATAARAASACPACRRARSIVSASARPRRVAARGVGVGHAEAARGSPSRAPPSPARVAAVSWS